MSALVAVVTDDRIGAFAARQRHPAAPDLPATIPTAVASLQVATDYPLDGAVAVTITRSQEPA